MAADAVGAVQVWLQARFPAAQVVTELPNKFELVLPVHRVARVGGARRLTFDAPRVSIETFAADQKTVCDEAERVADALMYEFPSKRVGSAFISRVQMDSGPQVIPYDNPNVRMATHAYTVHVFTTGTS